MGKADKDQKNKGQVKKLFHSHQNPSLEAVVLM